MKDLVGFVSIRLFLTDKSVEFLFEELYTVKKNPNVTVISCAELISSIHMTTHL